MKPFASEIWRSDMDRFKEATEQFYNKELSAKDYKGISGGYGSYAQRGGESSMLRLRLQGGRITKEKLRFSLRKDRPSSHSRPNRRSACCAGNARRSASG